MVSSNTVIVVQVLKSSARLEKNINIPFTRDTIYSSPNQTLQDQAWADDWDQIDLGVVAISENDARSMDLPETQKWPWDHSKGIYILNGFHDLHCIVRPTLPMTLLN